jgi:threonine/homoserine/homoserine lactone efflux protein
MEQSLPVFLASALLISLSGVLSPGPMTAAVIQHGARSRLSGVWVSLGHGVVEVPLILLLFVGAGKFLENELVRIVVGLAGGAYLIYMAKGLLRPGELVAAQGARAPSSLLAGMLLSIGNPYFLLWWATIGLGLVLSAIGFGILGLVLFIIVHWIADLVWYTFLSVVAHKGVNTFGSSLYRKVCLLCGGAVFFFGGMFIIGALRLIMGKGT